MTGKMIAFEKPLPLLLNQWYIDIISCENVLNNSKYGQISSTVFTKMLKSVSFNLLKWKSAKTHFKLFDYCMNLTTHNRGSRALGYHGSEGYDNKVGYLVVS